MLKKRFAFDPTLVLILFEIRLENHQTKPVRESGAFGAKFSPAAIEWATRESRL